MQAGNTRRVTMHGPRSIWSRTILAVALVTTVTSGVVGSSIDATAATVASAGHAGALGPMVRLVGSATSLPHGATVLGPTDQTVQVTVEVALRPRDPAALDEFAKAVSTAGSPQFHQYLSAGHLAETFGPTPGALRATRSWLTSTGLSVGATSADGLLVPVTGSVGELERVFDTTLVQAHLADGRVARLSPREPVVPSSLSPTIEGILGLSTSAIASPHLLAGKAQSGVPVDGAAVAAPLVQAGPQACAQAAGYAVNGRTATQLASTYGLTPLYGNGRVGAGQTVGIFELEPFFASDIAAYQACYGTHVPVTTVVVDGGATSPQSGEAALDIEVVAGLAPGSSVTVYSGPNDGATGPIDTYARMVNDDTAKVLTTSWGQCEQAFTGADGQAELQAEATLFAEAAAQGQTVLAASGDSGSTDCIGQTGFTGLAVDDPAGQPNVTGVGGTSLLWASADAPGEQVWNSTRAAGGGGNSTVFAAPAWQQVARVRSQYTAYTCGVPANKQCRQVPDVAASSDPNYGDVIYFAGTWGLFGGTSQAAPLWAALVADTNQGCAAPAGLLNPSIYASGAATSFNDVTVGNNALVPVVNPKYPATNGYDLASGWGSPRAGALLGLLSGSSAGCPTVTGLNPALGPATGGTLVTISGSGFGSGSPTVAFDGIPASVVSATSTSITVITPSVGSGRTSVVTVTTTGVAAGTSPAVAGSMFTFVVPDITSVTPARGPVSGGGAVTISGSGFIDVTSVSFGGVPATFVVTGPGSISATVPPGPAQGGTVDVVVTAASGVSRNSSGDHYTYALLGYWLVASDGGIFAYGAAGFFGSTGALTLNKPIVGMAATPDAHGYWLVASDGGIFAFGDAGFYGSAGALTLNKSIVGMASTTDGRGYWLVASDGGIFAYGDAGFYGSTGALTLNKPIVGMAATPDGRGYWLVASDGGIFAFGDAAFFGSTGALTLNKPIVGMAATPDGRGYWLVASDGGIFAFGDAPFFGSTGALTLNKPIVSMAADLSGQGYWLVASDGGIFAFGDAGFYGSTGSISLTRPVVSMASS